MKEYISTHLIKSEDLNHHGTLFAGRMAEWFVEGTFVAAASLYGNPENIVCVKVHGMKFARPAAKGDIITLVTTVVYTGNTSLTVYGKVCRLDSENILVDGFVTFACVDKDGRKMPHNVVLPEPHDEEQRKLRETAKTLR
ncbi:MAG: acyl-CoA thioesterase [Clostridia bacterium]